MDTTNPLAAPTAANPTPWRGKPRHPFSPMRLYRRFAPIGYPWTTLCIVTGQLWFAIPMYFIEHRKLQNKWARPYSTIQLRSDDIEGFAVSR